MCPSSSQTRDTAERLVVIDLLGQTRGRTRSSLYRDLRRDQDTIDAAIDSLVEAGIITTRGERVLATPALERLESLQLIGI